MDACVKTILHMDMDCFYAAVETRDNPSLRGKPVIVGAHPGERGVISACNYEARKFGLHSAMPISRAFKLCPQGIYLPVDMEKYEVESEKVMAILGRFTDRIEQISVDEAYLDISDLGLLFGTPDKIGRNIKAAVSLETSLTASVGIAPNKFISKIASDLKKPDGFMIVLPEELRGFLAPLPVSRLPGIGNKSNEALKHIGIHTVNDLFHFPANVLISKFGRTTADYLKDLAAGKGNDEISVERESKSLSREHTFQKDTSDRALLREVLLSLTDDVARRVRKHGLKGRTIALNFRTTEFTRNTRHQTIPEPTDESNVMFGIVESLFKKEIPSGTKIRLIGMGISNFGEETVEAQLNMFASPEKSDKKHSRMDAVMDKIQGKFGDHAIERASLLKRE